MGARRLRLSGFETEVLGVIASGFRFSSLDLASLPLVLDRNLFDSFLPDPADIAVTASAADNGFPYDPLLEPAVAFYRQPGKGIDPSSSSGGRLSFNVLIVLRVPKTLAEARDLLGELVIWLENNAVGQITTHYKIAGYQTLGMPVPYLRLQDDKSAASATVRFLAVARN